MHYYEIDMFIPRVFLRDWLINSGYVFANSFWDWCLQNWHIHSEIDFCKIDIFLAGLSHIDIERCHRAWQGEDLCWQGSETRSWYATSNKQFAYSATSATVLLPLIFAYPTMQEAAVPPLIRRSSPVKLLSRPSAGVSPREAARKKRVSSILDLGVNNKSIRLD